MYTGTDKLTMLMTLCCAECADVDWNEPHLMGEEGGYSQQRGACSSRKSQIGVLAQAM
jgi:hypothetical protein